MSINLEVDKNTNLSTHSFLGSGIQDLLAGFSAQGFISLQLGVLQMWPRPQAGVGEDLLPVSFRSLAELIPV